MVEVASLVSLCLDALKKDIIHGKCFSIIMLFFSSLYFFRMKKCLECGYDLLKSGVKSTVQNGCRGWCSTSCPFTSFWVVGRLNQVFAPLRIVEAAKWTVCCVLTLATNIMFIFTLCLLPFRMNCMQGTCKGLCYFMHWLYFSLVLCIVCVKFINSIDDTIAKAVVSMSPLMIIGIKLLTAAVSSMYSQFLTLIGSRSYSHWNRPLEGQQLEGYSIDHLTNKRKRGR